MRVVIQRISGGGPQPSVFRLVASGGPKSYYPADFNSVAQLVNALRAAIPEFDKHAPSLRYGPGIIFAEDMKLDTSQLALLGLKERA